MDSREPLRAEHAVISITEEDIYAEETHEALTMSKDYTQHRDVDRGWAWVVLAACMMAQMITGTISVSVGIFQTQFLAEFSGSNSYISLISSIFVSLQLTMGPIAGVMCNVFGMRAAMMTGGVLLSVGLFLSGFGTNLHHLLGMYGIVAGAGFGITYTPLNVIMGHYFHKRRGLANGLSIAACGIGVGPGTSVMVWIIENYGWRYAMSISACLALQMTCIGSMFYSLTKGPVSSACCSRERSEIQIEKVHTSRKQSRVWFLGHPHWWILCISYGISMVGFAVHLIHFPSYALSCGVSNLELSNLMTAFGIVMSISRILGGFFCNDSSVDLLIVMFATQGIYGVLILFMPFYGKSYPGLMAYQVMMSLFYGTSLVPITPFVAQLFGVDKLATVFGWIMMFGGMGYLTGPVVAGVLYDVTSTYSVGFYVGGTTVVVSAILLLLIPLTKVKVTELVTDKPKRLIHKDQTISIEKPATDGLDTSC